MSELKSLLNEFDISLSDDDEMDRRDDKSRDRGEIDFDDYDGEGEESGEFDMSGDEGEGEFGGDDEGEFGEEGEFDDEGDEEGEFAGEKRVDITDKLKAMLQRRGEAGGEDGEMNGDEELPSLGDLDLDDEDGELGMDDDEDLDFDYNAFKNGEESRRPKSDEDDEGEFNFSGFSR